MAKSQKAKGGSNKKKGRNLSKCAYYKSMGVRLTNKRRRIAKHLKLHPNDQVALKSV